MNDMIKAVQELGLNVALIVVLLYWISNLQKKLVSIIENNTAALTMHQDAMEKLSEKISGCPNNKS
jgi:hypothetical protein